MLFTSSWNLFLMLFASSLKIDKSLKIWKSSNMSLAQCFCFVSNWTEGDWTKLRKLANIEYHIHHAISFQDIPKFSRFSNLMQKASESHFIDKPDFFEISNLFSSSKFEPKKLKLHFFRLRVRTSSVVQSVPFFLETIRKKDERFSVWLFFKRWEIQLLTLKKSAT